MRCSLCQSREISYSNAVVQEGFQIKFGVCSDHTGKEDIDRAGLKAERKLAKLVRAQGRGKRLVEDDCISCGGSGKLQGGPCWVCLGRGRVLSGWESVNLVFAN